MILRDKHGRWYHLPSDARRVPAVGWGFWRGVGYGLLIETAAVVGALGLGLLFGWIG